jgi:hypothetical protein
LEQNRLDGLWHQSFKDYLRMALIGRNHEKETTFETTVRKAIDCRLFGYTDLTQADIYNTSHDVEGFRNERLYNFFLNSGITDLADIEKRTKLAFACLLTAVGLPMILGSDKQVVVLANFSDFGTPDPFNSTSEYFVPNWPPTPQGKNWREIPQDRDVSPGQIGREPLFPWEAKVYALV